MDDKKIYNAVKRFVNNWSDKGRDSEKSYTQSFWRELLAALGVDNPSDFIQFEKPVKIDGKDGSIDAFIERTGVVIEQKSRGVDLDKPAHQTGDKFLTPFEQAKRYADALPRSTHLRWIVTCNFDEFRIYDLDRRSAIGSTEPFTVKFAHLAAKYRYLNFLVDPNDDNVEEVKLSKEAAANVAQIGRSFACKMLAPRKFKAEDDPVKYLSPEQRNILNQFCVRLVFCLYAEDAALFDPNQFVDYIKAAANQSRALTDLFTVLNTPEDQRPADLPDVLRAFKYVNGGLFEGSALNLPPFDKAVADDIITKAREREHNKPLNWFTINPTIFGALFESSLNPETRRHGGMHYTSVDNIHKVIKPLFLDALNDEFDSIKRLRKNKRAALEDFQDKLASLTFLDPACGSGNFLTETYINLRELENDVLRELLKFDAVCHIKVSINQFYGIELNDFACAIAQTAMWIAEHKMLFDTEVGIRERVKYLPLKHSARIVCANALDIDWNEVTDGSVDYIIGNPPFSGARLMSAANKADLLRVFDGLKDAGNLDFVACWFKKAADFMSRDSYPIRAALVATNSITQGEAVGVLWRKLFETVHIDFAHRTFKWTHEQDDVDKTAAVHCVIVGFSAAPNDELRVIFDGDETIETDNINGYLLPAPNFFVTSRSTPLSAVPTMSYGNMPIDGGKYLFKADEKEEFIRREPRAEKYFRRWIGAEEFINGKERWCLWLGEAAEDDLRLPLIAERVEAVRRYRLASKRAATRKLADTPTRFHFENMPKGNFILVPRVSSERRFYIPIGFMPPSIIASDATLIMPDADLFHFGVLTSSVHMAWTRMVCGRLESRYRYSTQIVYNNFPWCGRSPLIAQTAQQILDARALYPSWTLAALYDQQKMPPELRTAHEANDLAVLDAYGFDAGLSELEIVVRLMEMYQRLTAGASTDKI